MFVSGHNHMVSLLVWASTLGKHLAVLTWLKPNIAVQWHQLLITNTCTGGQNCCIAPPIASQIAFGTDFTIQEVTSLHSRAGQPLRLGLVFPQTLTYLSMHTRSLTRLVIQLICPALGCRLVLHYTWHLSCIIPASLSFTIPTTWGAYLALNIPPPHWSLKCDWGPAANHLNQIGSHHHS